jgi:hypothetical protein
MPEIRIAYDLPSFKHAFTWTATEAEAAELLDDQLAAIAGRGLDPAMLNDAVVQAPAILGARGDAVSVRSMHVLLTAWTLQQTTGHSDFAGRVIDYLPTHDFDVVITKVEPGEISATIKAQARADFAGSA